MDKNSTQKLFRPSQGVSNFSQMLKIKRNEPKPIVKKKDDKEVDRFEKIKANLR